LLYSSTLSSSNKCIYDAKVFRERFCGRVSAVVCHGLSTRSWIGNASDGAHPSVKDHGRRPQKWRICTQARASIASRSLHVLYPLTMRGLARTPVCTSQLPLFCQPIYTLFFSERNSQVTHLLSAELFFSKTTTIDFALLITKNCVT